MASLTEYENNEIYFDLNDISTFLYSIGYITRQNYNNIKQKEKIIPNNEIIFEKNLNISFTDASVKYGEMLSKINKLFCTNLSFEENFLQYKKYTNGKINFGTYLNYLIILDYIISNYNEILDIKKLLIISKEKLSIIEIDSVNSNSINNDLKKLYHNIKDKPIFNDKEINSNLIILLFFISFNNTIIIDSELNNINDFISKFSLYNKVYVSNIDIGLMLYIESIIFMYRFSMSNLEGSNNNNSGQILKVNQIHNSTNGKTTIRGKRRLNLKNEILEKIKKPFTSRTIIESDKNIKTEIGEHTITDYINNNNNKILNNNAINNEYFYLNDKNNIPNLFLFDNETIKFPYNIHLTIFMFQNYLKLFSFYALDKYKISLLTNLTIRNLFDLREEFSKENNEVHKKENKNKNNLEDDEEDNNKDYYSTKNYKNYNFNIFEEINMKSVKFIIFQNLGIFNSSIIYTCFKSLFFDHLLIKITCFDTDKKIEEINNLYISLIKKSNIFYIQEPQIISQCLYDNLTINDLYIQYNILIYLLDFYCKSKIIKKSELNMISFKFNSFKCHINRENKSIQLFFDFSKIKEKTLFQYLKKIQKILTLEQKYEIIICLLRDFKNYESTIRIIQSNFRSHQVNYLFSIIIKKLVDYVEEIKSSKINIVETKFNTFNPNMRVYLKNERLKKKTRIEQIRKIIQTFPLSHKIRALYNYLANLEESFDLIMISDNYNKNFRLIRRCDENQIFFFICKENKKENLLEKEKQNEDNKFASTGVGPELSKKKEKHGSKKQRGYTEYLQIIFYIKSDQISYINILNFLDCLIDDEQCEIQNNITIICDRFYLESYVIMEQSLKSTTKKLFSVVDSYFLISKKTKNSLNDDKESFNYDLYIADEYTAVANYHQYNHKKKDNYYEFVYEFLSCLSSCIELIIYTLRAKDIYLDKFFYILRTLNDKYFVFEYKNSNIFLKKLKEYDTLLFFNPKKTEPLLCLLPKIPESEYTMSVNNFYDLYLRLFLNLNKVEEKKDKLSQIFVYKIHKNIFYENYDSIILISFSYKAFNIFNEFFMKNNFLSTTKEKFINLYVFPFDKISHDKNYIDLLNNHLKNLSVVKNIQIFDYSFDSSLIYSSPNNFLMSYKKSEYLLEKSKEIINNKGFNENDKIKKMLFKNLKRKKCQKKYIKKTINNIIYLYNKNENENFNIYHLNMNDYENVLKNYQKNVYQIQTQKVDVRLQDLTEDAINNYNNTKNKQKQCYIF